MQEPAQPENEADRLRELHDLGILDSAPEQRFNRITRTAARAFGVPMSLVSLIDRDRQWFKSRFGLFVSETPRSVSFCGHAILSDSLLIVEDARVDERFADNPLVTGPPHIRFYAGRPVRGPGGKNIGTLCLLDTKPRVFGVEERVLLGDLVEWVEREINLDSVHYGATARLNCVLDVVASAVVIVNSDGQVESINSRAEMLFAADGHALIGSDVDTLFPPHSQKESIRQLLLDSPVDSERQTIQWSARRINGRPFAVTVTFTDFFEKGQRLFGLGVREA